MGYCIAKMTLANPAEKSLQPLEVEALADSGAAMLCIPQQVAAQLRLEPQQSMTVALGDGSVQSVPQVGPVRIRFKNRLYDTSALVIGDEVLLGAIPMQAMDLVVLPKEERVDVNPEHPNFAHHRVK